MITQKNYQQLRQAIIDAVSGIRKIDVCSTCGGKQIVMDENCNECGGSGETINDRKIRLADCLSAIEEKIVQDWSATAFPSETVGNFQPHLEKIGLDMLKKWSFQNNSLQHHWEHRKETVKFLWEIICKKK